MLGVIGGARRARKVTGSQLTLHVQAAQARTPAARRARTCAWLPTRTRGRHGRRQRVPGRSSEAFSITFPIGWLQAGQVHGGPPARRRFSLRTRLRRRRGRSSTAIPAAAASASMRCEASASLTRPPRSARASGPGTVQNSVCWREASCRDLGDYLRFVGRRPRRRARGPAPRPYGRRHRTSAYVIASQRTARRSPDTAKRMRPSGVPLVSAWWRLGVVSSSSWNSRTPRAASDDTATRSDSAGTMGTHDLGASRP